MIDRENLLRTMHGVLRPKITSKGVAIIKFLDTSPMLYFIPKCSCNWGCVRVQQIWQFYIEASYVSARVKPCAWCGRVYPYMSEYIRVGFSLWSRRVIVEPRNSCLFDLSILIFNCSSFESQ